MNKMKKIFTLLFAICMIFTVSIPTMATQTTSAVDADSTERNQTGVTYTYYVMMKLAENNGAIEYYVEDESLAKALLGLTIDGERFCTVTQVLGKDYWIVEINEEADFTEQEVGEALVTVKEYAVESGAIEGYEIEMDYGALVLIESSIGTTAVMETAAVMTVTKSVMPTMSLAADTANAEIGGTINYTIVVENLEYMASSGGIISGELSDGLTLDAGYTFEYVDTEGTNVKKEMSWIQSTEGQSAAGSTSDVSGTIQTKGENGTGYTITVPSDVIHKIQNYNQSGFKITYAATMNQNAKTGEAETNKASLTANSVGNTTSETDVYTFGFELNKVNESGKPIEGVKFTLTKERNGAGKAYYTLSDEGKVGGFKSEKYELSTDAEGKISFDGLAEGQYTLTETEAAAGYLLPENPIVVTIGSDGKVSIGSEGEKSAEVANGMNGNQTYYYGTITMTNSEWVTLADTGGSGTALLYVLGTVLVSAAVMLFVFLRRNGRSAVS